jgi:hypothetical protein
VNIIGLDIDGVFNSHGWFGCALRETLRSQAVTDFDRQVAKLDPRCVKRLNTIIEENDAYIVITSSWRTNGLETLRKYLSAAGLKEPERIIGVLPYAMPRGWVQFDSDYEHSYWMRGLETEIWVLQHIENPEQVRLVFIDDDSDFGRLKDLCWVRTTLFSGPETLDPVKYNYTGPYNGLQDDHIRQVRLRFEAQAEQTAGAIIVAEPHPQLTELGRKALYGG